MASRSWPPPPTLGGAFYKAHGLGNDYLVFETGPDWRADPRAVRRVCDRHSGIGSDGIVVLSTESDAGCFSLRMFNPDGSEFERSGNGLRVLASYLARANRVGSGPFCVDVGGGEVSMTVHGRDGATHDVSVDMGRAQVGAATIALESSALTPDGRLPGPRSEPIDVTPVWVGNPHIVVFGEALDGHRFQELGPFLSTHPAASHGANVQLAERVAPSRLRARIWERGVGPTSASGTSACAVAVAAVYRGCVAPGDIDVETEGGVLSIHVDHDFHVRLRGPVEEVMEGALTDTFLSTLVQDGD